MILIKGGECRCAKFSLAARMQAASTSLPTNRAFLHSFQQLEFVLSGGDDDRSEELFVDDRSEELFVSSNDGINMST